MKAEDFDDVQNRKHKFQVNFRIKNIHVEKIKIAKGKLMRVIIN